MTSQILASELANLIQDVKRKNPEIRAAAEKSLSDLKAFANVPETHLPEGLRRKPDFVRPFLLGCKSGNAKYAATSVVSLQRVVTANALAKERLEDVLEALRSCSELGTDVQLRVLQIMPTLFQRYSEQITESRLTNALQICFVLQASKNAVISNTAAATLQQVVNDVFSRVISDRARSETASPETTRVSWQAELDCHQVFHDLCLIAEGINVESLDKAAVSKDFAFELIGTILLNFTSVLPKYTNFVDILRQQLLPLILRIISSAASFNSTARALRLVPPIVKGFLDTLPTELEMLMSMLTYMLEPDAAPLWKRVMCMESIKEIYKDSNNILRAYALFDQQDGHKAIIQEQLNAIGRLVSEKPAIIGLGKASSMPTTVEQSSEDLDGLSALQADPLTATSGVSLTTKTSMSSGIGVEISTVKVALIDQLDKSEPPAIPSSYLYALPLTALNLLSEGIARYLLPFAALKPAKPGHRRPSKNEDREKEDTRNGELNRLPTNPLELITHPELNQIKAVCSLLQNCWPAFLNIYSTFFQAALDPDFYHGAIRAFQKIIQVVTLLQLATPRDAFLTALAKQALPVDLAAFISGANMEIDSQDSKNVPAALPRMSPRNLLCLRALLNLGISLGSLLDESWSILLNALRQADIVIGYITVERTLSSTGPAIIAPTTSSGGDVSKEFGNEVGAVRSAALRMLESTIELPEQQFLTFLQYLGAQIQGVVTTGSQDSSKERAHMLHSSVASDRIITMQSLRSNVFVIDAFTQVINYNGKRLSRCEPHPSGWTSIVRYLMRIVADDMAEADLRTSAAESICKSIFSATFDGVEPKIQSTLSAHAMLVLQEMADSAKVSSINEKSTNARLCAEEIHNKALQTQRACLEQYGESITAGWQHICALLLSVFESDSDGSPGEAMADQTRVSVAKPLSSKLLKSSFVSLQVVCSDIIDHLPFVHLPKVLRAVYLCSSQTLELNISLTATTLYQHISDSIWSGRETLMLPRAKDTTDDSDATAGLLWIQVLTSLCESSASTQSEIRNSSIHTCFQIVASVADRLLEEQWTFCILKVFLKLYETNKGSMPTSAGPENRKVEISLNETAATIQSGFCELLEENCSIIFSSREVNLLWVEIMTATSGFLDRKSLSLSSTVYSSLGKLLDAIDEEKIGFATCTAKTWSVWSSHNPSNHKRIEKPSASDNQKALSAYISCGLSLFQISNESQRTDVLDNILDQIQVSLANSTPTTYVNDIQNMTPLQADCHKLLLTLRSSFDDKKVPIFLEKCATMSTLPHEISRSSSEIKGPTFVAFVIEVIELIQNCFADKARSCNLHNHEVAVHVLVALHMILTPKASWEKDGRIITIWRSATSAASNISKSIVNLSCQEGFPKTSFKSLKATLDIVDAIVDHGKEQRSDKPTQASDLAFDIDAFEALYDLLIPNLGSEKLPDEARRKFSEILMLRSLIHEPHPDDSMNPDEETSCQQSRVGRVGDLPPDSKIKLCYILLDKMFEIIGSELSSKAYGRIARVTAPYLRLRVELVMKAYISDQPLRGRMPCPLSQRQELAYVLRRSIALVKITTPEGKADREPCPLGRAHVDSLKKLAVTAMRVTKHDEKTKEIILQLIES